MLFITAVFVYVMVALDKFTIKLYLSPQHNLITFGLGFGPSILFKVDTVWVWVICTLTALNMEKHDCENNALLKT